MAGAMPGLSKTIMTGVVVSFRASVNGDKAGAKEEAPASALSYTTQGIVYRI